MQFADSNGLAREYGVNLRALTDALRDEPLPTLVGEAAWRGIRSLRKSISQRAGQDAVCPVRFHPIDYYGMHRQLVSDEYRNPILAYADSILRGEYPLMGYGCPNLGKKPNWQCDWISGKSWPLENSDKMQIVRHDGSDVKTPWELSRLQFCPVVAKAWVLTSDRKYRNALEYLTTDWIVRNPVGKGVNWTVAMEASLRAISLCLTMELLEPFAEEEKPWREQMTASLWQHLRFIEVHSEFSFRVRSNHYLSNLVGLTTLSAYLRGSGMGGRLRKYARAVAREVLLQTYADGGDCEASTGYHFLVAQLALHSFDVQRRSLNAVSPKFEARLRLMFAWITALADDAWKLPHLGDCDNGRVELLADDIAQAMRPAGECDSLRVESLCRLASHLLQTPSDRCGEPMSLLPDSGIAVLRSSDASAVFCAMPNGLRGRGSHTHCDKLSVIFRLGTDEVFCDTGSRGYTRSAALRNLDRATRMHNTLMIDDMDQNTLPTDPGSLFRCGNEAAVSRIVMAAEVELAVEASHLGYSRLGIEHRRTVQLSDRELLLTDEVSGSGLHSLDLRFVLGPEWRVSSERITGEGVGCTIDGSCQLNLVCEAEGGLELSILPTAISRAYGASLPTSCVRIHSTTRLPATFQTRVTWDRRA